MRYKYKRIEVYSVNDYLKFLKRGYVCLKLRYYPLDSLKSALLDVKDKNKIFLFEYCYYMLNGKDYEKNKEMVREYIKPYLKDIYASYLLGIIENSTKSEALKYSAKKGFIPAIYNLGVLYDKNKEYEKARKCFEKCINNNKKEAYNNLGYYYLYGCGVTVDLEKAHKYLQKAIDLGETFYAPYNAGFYYLKKGYTECACIWFELAMKSGNKYAIFETGKCYYDLREYDKAREYFSNQDGIDVDKECIKYLGRLALYGQGEKQDLDKAEKYFKEYLDGGFEDAYFYLGIVSFRRKDYKKGYEYFLKDSRINQNRVSRNYVGIRYTLKDLQKEIIEKCNTVKNATTSLSFMCLENEKKEAIRYRNIILTSNIDHLFESTLRFRNFVLGENINNLITSYEDIKKKASNYMYSESSIQYFIYKIEIVNVKVVCDKLLKIIEKYEVEKDYSEAYFNLLFDNELFILIKNMISAFNTHFTSISNYRTILEEERKAEEIRRREEIEQVNRDSYNTKVDDYDYDYDYDYDDNDSDSSNGDTVLVDDWGNETVINSFGYDNDGNRWERESFGSDTYVIVDDDDD